MVAIAAEIDTRLSTLMLRKQFRLPPEVMTEVAPNLVLIGKAKKEQKAIAWLYHQVKAEHIQMHKTDGTPFGVNPHVSFEHYRKHVMMSVLKEMLEWSVHRAYPDSSDTDLLIRFDAKWNMYAGPPRKRKRLALTIRAYLVISSVYGTGSFLGWW